MLWLKLNKYRSLFRRKLSELTGRTRMHLRRLQWADWVVFNRLAKSNHILDHPIRKKHAGAKKQDPRTAAGPVGFSGTLMTHEANFSCDDGANRLFFSKLDFFRFSSSPHWTTAAIFTRQAQTEQKCKTEARHKVKKHVPGPAAGCTATNTSCYNIYSLGYPDVVRVLTATFPNAMQAKQMKTWSNRSLCGRCDVSTATHRKHHTAKSLHLKTGRSSRGVCTWLDLNCRVVGSTPS